MAEKRVVYKEHSTEELAALLSDFDYLEDGESLASHELLFGGFSGSNYKLVTSTDRAVVLKICNGYDFAHVAGLTKVMSHLWERGFHGMCRAYPVKADVATSQQADAATCCVTLRGGVPTVLLSFVAGKAADAVIRAGKVDPLMVMRGVGEGLGALSTVPVAASDGLRHCRDGGACMVGDHMRGAEMELLASHENSKDHPFTAFYTKELANLQAGMEAAGLPFGVLHGDPFFDNVLVDEGTGAFSGWVDWEDASTGPLLFDLACMCIGCCFRSEDNQLDLARLEAILRGYSAKRPIVAPAEVDLFLPFMRLTLLCNCEWRFRNFNIDHPDQVDNKDRYVELQERIQQLHDPATAAAVGEVVAKVVAGQAASAAGAGAGGDEGKA